MGKHIAFALLAAAALSSFAACADEPDYYEGELVPTRPIRKPSLDPNTPAELTGGGVNMNQNPAINETVLPTSLDFDHSMDGRISWADNVTTSDGVTQTQLHDLNSGTGIDTVTVLDELGNRQSQFELKYSADQINALRH